MRAYGTARAMDTADVPARVGAVVESLGANYAVGGTVKQGELLVRLDATDFDKQIVVSDEAIRGFDAQMALLDTQARALSQRSTVLHDLGRLDEAMQAAREAQALWQQVGTPAEQASAVGDVAMSLNSLRRRSEAGLGLSLAQRLIEMHGGRIDIVDVEDGSEVRCRIPFEAPAQPDAMVE